MRVLLSGGSKTKNIVTGIQKKFEYSGDEFIIVEYLDDIKELFVKGDDFDKAIITEQSITREYTITDEMELRSRVNDFANYMADKKNSKYSYVFLTQEESMAEIISDEIYSINDMSVVVLKKPPYAVTFFTSIIVTDVKQLPSELVYVPPMITSDNIADSNNDNESIEDDFDLEEYTSEIAPADFDNELFGLDGDGDNFEFDGSDELSDSDKETKIGDGFDINSGEGFDFDNNSDDINWNTSKDELSGFEDTEEQQELDFPKEDELDGFETPDNSFEPGFDFPDGDTIEDSFENTDGFDTLPDVGEENFDNLEGFINTEEENSDLDDWDNDTESSGFDFDNNDENIDMSNITPIEQSSDLPDYTEEINDTNTEELGNTFLPGFDDPDNIEEQGEDIETMEDNYGLDFDNTEINDNTQDTDMFDNEDYDTDEDDVQNAYTEPVKSENLAGFESSDYAVQQPVQPAPIQTQPEHQPRKRGLMDRLMGRNKNNSNNIASNNAVNESIMNPTPATISGYHDTKPVKSKVNPDQVRKALVPFAARGNSIVVTGCGGCGTSTIAYNLANIINQLGFTVLLVDMDTKGKTQSYISRANYESMEPEGANLMSAVNSSTGINKHISIVKNGFHLLTMGLGTDKATVNELLHKDKLARFANLAKADTDFIVYDIPFEDATNFLSDITYMTDNLVLVTDASNWGITKTLLNVCNISSDDMEATVFNRAQILFNRYRNLNKVMGKRVKTCADITKVMDQKVLELLGDDPGFHFKDFHIAGIVNDDPDFENGWFDVVQYSDTKKGQNIFLELVENIVLKK